MRYSQAWRLLALLELFVAITSITFGAGLVTGVIPLPVQWLRQTPFSDYTVLGLAMAVVVGGSALIAAVAIRATHDAGGILISVIAGILLAGFEVVEVSLIDPQLEYWLLLVVPLQVLYSALAIAIVGLSVFLWRRGAFRAHVRGERINPA
jgi:hypothetical protein